MHFALNQNIAKLVLFELLLSKSVALLQKYLKKERQTSIRPKPATLSQGRDSMATLKSKTP